MNTRLTALACLAGLAPAAAQAAPASRIEVHSAWARPTVPGAKAGAAYASLENPGSEPDRLISASTPWAEKMELHQSAVRGGVMTMRPAPEGLPLPAHGRVTLQPGGYHFMLSGLKRRLTVGARLPAELRFQRAGRVRVQFRVQAGPPGGSESMSGMGPMG